MKKLILTLAMASLVAIGARAQTASLTTTATNYLSTGGNVTFTATVVYPAGANTLTAVTVTAGGTGYTSAPTVVFTGGGGTGAAATATVSGGGAVTAVTITNPGSGYTTPPSVSFTGGGGTGATANASAKLPTSIGFYVNLPTGWTFVSQTLPSGASTNAAPTAGDQLLEWAFGGFPVTQLQWTFVASYPAGLSGGQVISVDATQSAYRPGPVLLTGVPDITLAPYVGLTAAATTPSKSLTATSPIVGPFVPVMAAGGTAPFTYSISPALSAGLSLNTTNGAITGTPTAATASGTPTNYTVTITDSLPTPATASNTFSLTINPALATSVAVGSKALTINTAAVAFTPVTASAGTAPYGFSVTPALPTGLSLNPTNGEITGTPTVASASATYTVTATDAAGATSPKTFALVVNSALVSTRVISAKVITQAATVAAFVPVTASGGTAPYVFTIATSLPAGLSLNASTGAISGAPTVAQSATSHVITVTDAAGAQSTQPFSLTVNPVVIVGAISGKVWTAGTAITPFSPVTVTGGTGAYTYAVAPALPSGLTLSSVTGLISGTPAAASVQQAYVITITDEGGAVAASPSFNLTINPVLASTLSVGTKALTQNAAAIAFTPVVPSGGTAPLGYTVAPALPVGLILNAATGAISGTPSATAAAAGYVITVTDAVGATTSQTLNLTVNSALVATSAVASRVLTAGSVAASFTPVTASSGTSGYTFSVSPALPPGLSLSASTGLISGTPTGSSAQQTFTITVTDAAGATASQPLTLSVNGPLAANIGIATKALTVGAAASFPPVAGGGGTAPYTYSVAPALPTGLSLSPTSGSISGTPVAAQIATTYTVTVTDASSATATGNFSLTINPALVASTAVAAKVLTAGTAAVSFVPVTGSAGTPPYTFAVNPGLPTALALNATTGAITGAANTASTSSAYTVTLTDAAGATASSSFNLTINVALASGPTVASRTLTASALAAPFTPLGLSGGTPPYAWSVAPTLPAGLSLSPASGVISGTPTAAQAAASYTVTGSDSVGALITQPVSILINPALTTTQALETVGPLSSGAAVVGSPIPVTATGGTPMPGSIPYAYAISPALPTGLTFGPNGAITGTPTVASGATTYTVTVTDSVGATSSKTFSLTVNGPLAANVAIPVKALTATSAATSFIPVTAGGGTIPYAFSIAPTLSSGLTLNTSTGAITGTPAAAVVATNYTVTVTDAASGSASAAFSLLINPALVTALDVATKALTSGVPAIPFAPVSATAGTAPYTFSVTPALPAGLSLDPATGLIGGTPTAAVGATNFTVTATDAANATSSKVVSLTVNPVLAAGSGIIATKALTAGKAAVSFSPLPLTGGTAPFAYAVNPALPDGLALNPTTGAITGTPSAAVAAATYTITAMDAAGAQVSQPLSLLVNPALVAISAIPAKVLINNVAATAFTPVTVTGGTAPLAFAIAPALPTGLSLTTTTGAISGTPTVNLAVSTFTVTITDAVGATASQAFTLAVNTAPVITTQPVNASVNQNGTATFSVVATGFPTPTFQWKKDGGDITGNASATTATLSLANAQVADEGAYSVVVTNASGSATSTPAATLTVYVLPAITTQPVAQTVLAGQSATFSVVATGKPTPTYQWRRNGNAVPGATNASLTLTNLTLTDGADYTVVVSNTNGALGGSVTSTPAATLTVNPIAPVIQSTPPLAATAVQGREFLFGPITLNNTPVTFTATGLTGAGTPGGLVVNPSLGNISGSPVNTGTFTIVLTATNVTGSDSRTITLTVQAPPPVITSPASAGGRVGTAFTFNVVATNSPTAYAANNLPAGLSINTGTGAITGTPTVPGTSVVQLTATNAAGSVSQPLVLNIAPPLNAPVYAGPVNLSGTQGTAFSFTPAFGTVTAPYALTGPLPTGLTFTAATGIIAGTPTQTGSFLLTLSATNAGGTTAVSLTLVVNAAAAAPAITSSSIAPGARAGTAFSFQLTSNGTPAASSYSASGLPTGLTLNTGTGLISGTPTVFGTFTVTVAATNTVGTGPSSILSISVAPSATAPVITSAPVVNNGQVGQVFSFTLTATPAATSFAITNGSLPAGLSLNTASGAITGTPSASGQTRVWFAATNGSGTGLAMEVLFSIAPASAAPVVNSNGHAGARVGQPFQYVITATNGPITAFVAAGRPAWLALDTATGVLSGVPTEENPLLILLLTATNAAGTSAPKMLTLNIAPAPATPLVTSSLTASGRVGAAFTYQVTGSETPTSYVATGLPPGLSIDAATGAITGTPTVSNTYNVTLRAANTAGLGATATLVIDIAPAALAPAITSAPVANAQVGMAFTYTIVATNGPILSYAANAKQLPAGLSLNTATGIISGTPADAPRIYLVELTATNATGTSLPQVLAINLTPALGVPVVMTPLFVNGTVGADFSFTITATNLTGSAPYAPPILLDAIGLPSGLAVNPATGVISGRPVATGATVVSLVATNAAGTGLPRDLTIVVLPAPTAPVVGGAFFAVGQVNQPFTYQIVASNTPTSYEVIGAPVWMNLNSVTGAVSGVPTAPGAFTVQLAASNAAGTSNLFTLGLSIAPAANTPVITSTRTASGTVGTAFTYTPAATPAATGYVASGLPGGLALNAVTGVISGTPNVSGTFKVILTPANANGVGAPAAIILTIRPNVTFGN